MSRLDHQPQARDRRRPPGDRGATPAPAPGSAASRRLPQASAPRLDGTGRGGGVWLVSLTAARALRHLAANPGASGAEVRHGAGVRHDSQISGLLARLERDGLAARRRDGRANAWTLTRRGERLLGGLPEEAYLPHDVGLVNG